MCQSALRVVVVGFSVLVLASACGRPVADEPVGTVAGQEAQDDEEAPAAPEAADAELTAGQPAPVSEPERELSPTEEPADENEGAEEEPAPVGAPMQAWAVESAGTSESLNAVAALSSDNIWAVGNNGVVCRFDGSAWQQDFVGVRATLHAVWAADASHVWAVGVDATDGRSYVFFHDGAAWSTAYESELEQADSPDAYRPELRGVWGTSATDVWVVGGHQFGGWPAIETGVILHWDGSTWSAEKLPQGPRLLGIHGRSGSDIWAVGRDAGLMHFDGSRWSNAAVGWLTPTRMHGQIWVAADGEAWATGHPNNTDGAYHFNNAGWAPVPLEVDVRGFTGTTSGHVVGVGDGITELRDGVWSVVMRTEDVDGLLTAVAATSDGALVAVGTGGTVMRQR